MIFTEMLINYEWLVYLYIGIYSFTIFSKYMPFHLLNASALLILVTIIGEVQIPKLFTFIPVVLGYALTSRSIWQLREISTLLASLLFIGLSVWRFDHDLNIYLINIFHCLYLLLIYYFNFPDQRVRSVSDDEEEDNKGFAICSKSRIVEFFLIVLMIFIFCSVVDCKLLSVGESDRKAIYCTINDQACTYWLTNLLIVESCKLLYCLVVSDNDENEDFEYEDLEKLVLTKGIEEIV